MCFSASASFAASGMLAAAGGATARLKPERSLRWFAAVPFLFSAQQFIEGVQWLLPKETLVSTIFGYGFLAFAFVLWPAYLPYAVMRAEPDPKRQKLLRLFVCLGVPVALYLLGVMIFSPLSIVVDQCHINYIVPIPYGFTVTLLYVIAVTFVSLCSTRRYIQLFGAATLLGGSATAWFAFEMFTSVWCFVCAILSTIIFLEMRSRQVVVEDTVSAMA